MILFNYNVLIYYEKRGIIASKCIVLLFLSRQKCSDVVVEKNGSIIMWMEFNLWQVTIALWQKKPTLSFYQDHQDQYYYINTNKQTDNFD